MSLNDGLLLLRNSIATSSLPLLTTSDDVNTAETNQTESLALATHLYFSSPLPQCLPLSDATRFISTTPDTAPVDLRSIYFAWIKKDIPVNEYIALAQDLDGQLPEAQRVRNLVFVERLDLITWLEGASDESEYIKPLEGPEAATVDAAAKAADVAGGTGVPTVSGAGVGVVQPSGVGGRPGKVIDARLQEIYNEERLMGDRNSVLRGIKPTVSWIYPVFAVVGSKFGQRSYFADPHVIRVGLLSCPEDGRGISRETAQATSWPSSSSWSAREARSDNASQSASTWASKTSHIPIKASRSDYPTLTLCILAAPLIEHQIFP